MNMDKKNPLKIEIKNSSSKSSSGNTRPKTKSKKVSVYVLNGKTMGEFLGTTSKGNLTISNPASNKTGFYLHNNSSSTITSVAVSSPALKSDGTIGVWTYLAPGTGPWETWYNNFTTTISVKPGQGLIINTKQMEENNMPISTISFKVNF